MKVKVLICNFLMLAAFLPTAALQAQTIEKNRTVTESFLVSKDAEIEIANKYGSIYLVPWKKDSVRFEIEISVKGTKESKVDKSFDFIEIDFTTSKYYVIAETGFAGQSSFWSDVSDLTGEIFNTNTKTQVDYTIHLPEGAKLKIMNKYGNIYTTNHTGPVEIDLSNGDLKAHHFSGKTNISVDLGNADIRKIDNGQLNISYGELHLDEAGSIALESKSSKIYLSQTDRLKLESKRDRIYLNKVKRLSGNIYFTTVSVDQLQSVFDITAKYGEVEVMKFADATESFKLKSENTDVTLHFIDEKHYKMDITVDERTEVLYSSDIKNISTQPIAGDEKLISVKCTIGSLKSKTVPLNMDVRGGTLSLKLK